MSTQSSESHPSSPLDGTDTDDRTDNQPHRRDGRHDPLPNRGDSDLTFGDLASDHDDPDTLFERVITNNPHTCPNCFARLGRQWELPNCKRAEQLDGLATYIHHETPYQIPKNKRNGRLDWRYYQTEAFPERTGFDVSPRKYEAPKRILVCWHCGHERHPPDGPTTYGLYTGDDEGVPHVPVADPDDDSVSDESDDEQTSTRDNPRNLITMVRTAHTLSDTLAEYGISHDARVLVETVRRLNGINQLTPYDDEVFGRAVARAVRAYRLLADADETSVFHRPQPADIGADTHSER